jgi:hypothetical protein
MKLNARIPANSEIIFNKMGKIQQRNVRNTNGKVNSCMGCIDIYATAKEGF